jgi:hypothetical protein
MTRTPAFKFLLLLVLLSVTAGSGRRLRLALPQASAGAQQEREALYLPDNRALNLISFGYRNVLADVLWFNTVNYFGKHFRSDHRYTWLNHMCGLVTDLDRRQRHVYEFCSLMLAWEGGDPESAAKLLDKALVSESEYWRYYYLRGIIEAYFLKADERAQNDFRAGATKRGAPPFLARLAAKKLMDLNNPETAVSFLEELIAGASDPNQKQALIRQLNKTVKALQPKRTE